MNCDEANILMHALIDGELDAGNARDVEAHVASCPKCATDLHSFQNLRQAIDGADLGYATPSSLRRKIEGALPGRQAARPDRRAVLKGFSLGAVATALAASGVVAIVMRDDDQRRVLGEVVSAHLRSLQGQHLIDVQSSDQHTVKPWFNGRLDVAPPVVDLTAQGFTLIGGRLDYLDAKPAAVIVYRRRVHVINLFCSPAPGSEDRAAVMESLQGFNVRRWTQNGLDLWAVSDLNADELKEFGQKFETATRK
ncbi:MAG TPA: anti-sigma factor [Pseudolabrys sp.]|nr:anti-sigma factor [Pseudolabrys sp.]